MAISPAASAKDSTPAPQTDAVRIELAYTSDVAATLSGGADKRARYLGNVDLTADIDLDELVGWRGGRAFIYGLGNFGKRPNDSAGTLEGVNNIEVGKSAARLFEAWVEQDLGSASLRAGLYDLNSEFYASDSAGLLIALPFGIGSELAATGANGPSIFPSTALAVRLRADLNGGNGYVQAAAFNARAQTWGDHGGIDTSFDDGVLLIGEAGHAIGPARFSLGAWTYTKRQEDGFATDAAGDPLMRKAWGVYGMMEAHVFGSEDGPSLDAFLRGGASDGRTSDFSWAAHTGILYGPVWPGRDDSALSLGLRYARTSTPFRDTMRAAGETPSRHEYGLELTYADRIAPFLMLQPDIQIVGNPGGVAGAPAALITTLRITIEMPPLRR
jgi:porin